MECLNTDNASKANIGKKRRTVGQKPSSLMVDGMKKPVAAAQAAAAGNKENNDKGEESSDVDLDCLACGSWMNESQPIESVSHTLLTAAEPWCSKITIIYSSSCTYYSHLEMTSELENV